MGEVIYKEITPYTENADQWKDITINSGASQRTLDDIKLPETAGCFTYSGNRKAAEGTSNRFIYWRTFNDVMELVEVSLDVALRGNCLRLHFERSPILQGASIHEMADQVVLLVSTVSTIHKLSFIHPRKLQGSDYPRKRTDVVLPSIFYDASMFKMHDNSCFYVLNHIMSAKVPLPHMSCSWLTPNGEAAFVLANRLGSHLLVIMDQHNTEKVITIELNRTSVVSRLWNGFMRTNQDSDVAISIVCHQGHTDAYIFSLCRDLQIRMWSQQKQECLMIVSVFDHHEENESVIPLNYNAQQCYLKKSCDSTSSNYYLGVYISQTSQNQFFVFQPLYISEQYRLARVATLHHEKHDLVDFCLSSSCVWSLWLNADSEPVVKITTIECDNQTPVSVSWLSVELEPAVSRDIFLPYGEVHPKEAYVKEIFRHGRFSPSTISKAINIYRRIADNSFSGSVPLSHASLREEAVKAVENEIFTRLRETELSEEEQHNLHTSCWDKFFSYCIQYHEVGTKPLGLAFDPVSGYAIVIKKNIYSLLCPCDSIEQLLLTNKNGYGLSAIMLSTLINKDSYLSTSMLTIFQCIKLIKKNQTDEMVVGFEHDLHHLRCPNESVKEIIIDMGLSSGDSNACLLMNLHSLLKQANNLLPALRLLLKKLDLGVKEEICEIDVEDSIYPFSDNPNFLSGFAGISVLCEGISQLAKRRLAFCRDLLILEEIAVQLGRSGGMSMEISDRMEEEIIPLTKLLIQAYYAIQWCTECEFIPKQASFLESGLKQLSLLDISDLGSPTKYKSESSMLKTVVYYFVMRMKGAYYLPSSEVDNRDFNSKNWRVILPQLITSITQLLWPLGPYFQFPEFLLSQCQYMQLQGYVRILENWCDWNAYSRLFLSANCFLIMGEYEKSLSLFVKSAKGVDLEEYLHTKIMQGIDESTTSTTAEYYMKVIQMFEQYGLSQCIVTLAETAIGILNKEDKHVPIFWSLVFKHHLELGRSTEAYSALTMNPDPSRQKDCLRQLIVVLCERKQYQTLVDFSYANMIDEVVSILESRARSSDLLKLDFYDLLYAFHIRTDNFRKAASIMFEYGMRLGQEVCSFDGLQKQAACYLITINCLHLVSPTYAWIVKPVPKVANLNNGTLNEHPGMSPKRSSDGEEIFHYASKKNIEVLEIPDIRREYHLIRARLLLVERDQSPTNMAATPLCANDCVSLLINAGLFDAAFELCKWFSLPLVPIFEGLTYRCINLMQCKSQWLKDNEVECFEWLSQNESVLCPSSGFLGAYEQMWYLLKQYLKEHEEEGQTLFHRSITSKLLTFGVQVPAWLKHSYQKRHAAELLMLYINAGMLEDAAEFSIDFLDSVIEDDATSYGIKTSLKDPNTRISMPHVYFDALLDALEDINNGVYCGKLYDSLTDKLKQYDEKIMSISESLKNSFKKC